MAETYIITAKTVAEAVALAKREYEDADHEISYEIVKMEKKGLFGLLGARDAQIKVTVSKVVSVQSELGSLVADIKNLKSVTDRGSSGTPAPAPAQEKPQQPQQPQQQQKQQKQNQNQQKQQNQNQKQNQPKQQQQQNQPKADKQQQNNPQPKQQNQPKQQQQQQNQPKAEKQQNNPQPKQQQNQQQKQQNNQPKQQNNNQQKQQQNQPKAEKPAEKPVEAPVTAEPAEKAAETPYRSALGNQATPRKRNRQKKAVPAEEDLSAAVTVSAPVGLTDFVSEGNESGFGSGENKSAGSSGGRMNNDIRKKNRNQKPAAADKPTEKPAEEAPALSTTVVPASEVPSRSRRSRGRGRGPVQRTDSDAMASRYDMAESDEDYEKLNALVAEAESVFEAKKAEAEPVHEERRREAITEAEMNYALDFVNTLLGNMHLDAHAVPAECPEGEEFDVTEEATVYPKIDIVGEETGILIGHHGETLDSIQYLANLCALRRTKSRDGDYVKIVVDIENYRQKREDTLRTLARRMAARAVKYRRNVFLEPMNAYERRIIHSELQSYDGVSTHSVGTDRDRKIIVTYEGPDKQPDRRRGEEKPAEQQNQQQNQQSGQGKKRSRGRRGGDRSAQAAAAEPAVNPDSEQKESRERRRPRKQQKMSIEELTDWLPDAGEATGEIDDTLNVMSGLRSRVSDDLNDAADAAEAEAIEVDEVVEETAEAAAKAEEAVREAEAKFEAKAAALLETLGALADGKDDE